MPNTPPEHRLASALASVATLLEVIAGSPDEFLDEYASCTAEKETLRRALNRLRKWADVDCPEF